MVLVHTGTPEDGPLFGGFVEAGAERGLRHLSYSRPGYGDSDRMPGRRVADCAADVAAIADALGIESFFVLGWSGGGPHALASAALLPERVRAAATVAAAAPYRAEGLDWLAGMGEENLAEFGAAETGEDALRAYLEGEVEGVDSVNGENLREAFGDLVCEADRRALTGEVAEYLAGAIQEAVRNGIWGWFDDDMAFIREWGFDVGSVEVPVTIWHGDEDRFVPFSHGEWLADNVSEARSCLRAGEGHISLAVGAYDQILDQLTG